MSLQEDIAIILNTDVLERIDCKELIQLLSSSRDMRKQIIDIGVGQWQRWTDAIEHKASPESEALGIKEWKFPVFDDVFERVRNKTEEVIAKQRAANVFYANCLHNHLFKKYKVGENMKEKWHGAIIKKQERDLKKQQRDFENFAYFTNVTKIDDNAYYFLRKVPNRDKAVSVPYGVEEIGKFAFYDLNLISVDIPNSVKKIGDSAFCQNFLTWVLIPYSVKNIDAYAFQRNELVSVDIPYSVEYIGKFAFSQNNLESVSIGESTKIEDNTFDENVEIIRPSDSQSDEDALKF